MFPKIFNRFDEKRDAWQEAVIKKLSGKRNDASYHDNDSDPEAEPLYAVEPSISVLQSRQQSLRTRSGPFVFHLALILFYTATFLYLSHARRGFFDKNAATIVKSPANPIMVYEPEFFNTSLCIDSPFIGEPNARSDQAWSELLQYSHVRITSEDLSKINKTSIALPDEEDAYWGTFGVIHELHCLKRIRQFIHKDYYHPGLSAQQERMNAIHTDHCLEILRQATMCRGDVSLVTMYWADDSPIPAADFTVPHACANWDAIQDWAKDKAFDPMKPGYLNHPTLGASFPDGSNHGLGVPEGHAGHMHDMMMQHSSTGCAPQ